MKVFILSLPLLLGSSRAAQSNEVGVFRRLFERHRRRLQPPPPQGGDGDAAAEPTYELCEDEDLPCTAQLLNDVGFTTASGTDPSTDAFLDVGENIYGPFEAGFGESQSDILIELGCTDDNVESAYVDGGIDTKTALSMINYGCDLSLPYTDSGGVYRDLLDMCGGHTVEYHFHERLSCLYEASGAHSTQVGIGLDGKRLYGKWENADASELPLLDACGGHFGTTPDSGGESIYHYHVQENAPFTFGCYGPNIDETNQRLVSVAECRAMYDTCGDDVTPLTLEGGSIVDYDLYCPCFDADGSNVGDAVLPALANATLKYGPPSADIANAGDADNVSSLLDSSTTSGIHHVVACVVIAFAVAQV